MQCNKDDSKHSKDENDSSGKENEEISKKETCSYVAFDLAYSARACVEQLHLFSSIVVKIKLLTKNQLPRLSGRDLNVCFNVGSTLRMGPSGPIEVHRFV